MPTAKEGLCHLLELAEEGPARRAALIGELADLLLAWPGDWPEAMRAPVTALLERTSRESDDGARAKLAARLGGHGELPLDLVNEFYLCAPGSLRREILMRNELAGACGDTLAADAAFVIEAARNGTACDFAESFAAAFAIAPRTAQAILADSSGEALAVLCKGAHVERAAFSALALLNGAGEAALSAFDTVPQRAAERLTRYWQIHHAAPELARTAAAE